MNFERLKNLSPIIPRDNLQALIKLQEHYEIILKHEIDHTRRIAEKNTSLTLKESMISGIARGWSLLVFKGIQTSSDHEGLDWAYAMSFGLLEKRLKNKMDLGDYLEKQTDILRALRQRP